MSKACKNRIDIDKEMLKKFTKATITAINEVLDGITVEEIIEDTFMKSTDEDVNYLIREYEKQLLLSKVNQEAFRTKLHTYFIRMEKYIKLNKLYTKFFKLVHYVHVILDSRRVRRNLIVAYQNILIQQYAYFTGSTKNIAYGNTTDNKLLLTAEVMEGTTDINYELGTNKDMSIEKVIKLYRKYGYSVESFFDMNMISVTDQCNTNMVFACCYYVNEITQDLKIENYRNPSHLPILTDTQVDQFRNTDKLHEELQLRNRMLPKQGVYVRVKGILDIEELYIKELFKEERVHLIFKVEFEDGTQTLGWIDINYKVYYDMWKYGKLTLMNDSTLETLKSSTPANFSQILESTVLQSYAKLVLDNLDAELQYINEVGSLEELESTTNPSIYYEIREDNAIKTPNGHKHFNKNEYIETTKGVEPFTRRLPLGESASSDAIENARKLGIKLSQGYTFVRGFDRAVRIIKK